MSLYNKFEKETPNVLILYVDNFANSKCTICFYCGKKI